MRLSHFLAVSTAVLFTFPMGGLAEDAFVVPVDRPEKAGLKRNMAIEVENSLAMTWKMNGEVAEDKKEGWKASLEAALTTEKVDEKGNPTEMTIVVRKFSLTEENETTEPLKPDTVVKAVRVGDKDQFTVNGVDVEEDAKKVFDMAIHLGTVSKGDDNKAFGVDQPRKPGESWDVNAAELIATLPDDMPFVIDAATTKGKMRFTELTGEGDARLATIQGEVDLGVTGMKGLPPGFKTEGSTLKVALDGQFPIDPALQPVREGLGMIIDITGSMAGPDGQNASLKMNARIWQKNRELP